MKKLWSHGWFAALLAGVAFLLIPTVSAGAATSDDDPGQGPGGRARERNRPDAGGGTDRIRRRRRTEGPCRRGSARQGSDRSDEPPLPQVPDPAAVGEPLLAERQGGPGSRQRRCAAPASRSSKVTPDRMTIEAEGTAEQIEAYFETTLADYEVGEETVRLASSPLSAPTNVAPLITGVRGVNEIRAKPANLTGAGDGAAGQGHGPWGWPGHGHGHGWHWPPPPEEEEEEIAQPAGFRLATPCSAYYGQELAEHPAGLRRRLPEPAAVRGVRLQARAAAGRLQPDRRDRRRQRRLGRDGRGRRRLRVADALQRRGRIREEEPGRRPHGTARSSGGRASSRR